MTSSEVLVFCIWKRILFPHTVAKHAQLAYDECFGFVPLLALGGFKDVDHMDKVKVLEHIYLMYQLTGGVMDD